MMLRDDPCSSIALLSSTSVTFSMSCIKDNYDEKGYNANHSHKNTTVPSSNLLLLRLFLVRSELHDGSMSSLMAYVSTTLCFELKSVQSKDFKFKQSLQPLSHLLEIYLALGLHRCISFSSLPEAETINTCQKQSQRLAPRGGGGGVPA